MVLTNDSKSGDQKYKLALGHMIVLSKAKFGHRNAMIRLKPETCISFRCKSPHTQFQNRIGILRSNNPIKSMVMRADVEKGRMLIRVNYELMPVSFGDIIFIKALADYIIVKTTTGKHITLCTMKEVEEILPQEMFARSHRSFIVNLERVSFVRGSNIEMIDNDYRFTIPIGRAYKKDFRSSLQAA